MEANLSHIHVSSFLKIAPWCVYHINVVHLAACQDTTQLALKRILHFCGVDEDLKVSYYTYNKVAICNIISPVDVVFARYVNT